MIASATGRPSILILDRGLLDNKGYIEAAGWGRVIESLDESSDQRRQLGCLRLLHNYCN